MRVIKKQFSIATLLVVATAMPFVIYALVMETVFRPAEIRTRGCSRWGTDGSRSYFFFGVRGEELVFAVITDNNHEECLLTAEGDAEGFRKATILRNDGQIVAIPSDHQIVECLAGELRTCQMKITLAEFEAYLGSAQARYCIDTMISYVRKLRKGK